MLIRLLIIAALFVLLIAALAWWPLRRAAAEARLRRARREFHRRREWLEARFFERAAHSGKPRDLRWVECRFDDAVHYARHRKTGELCALVAVTVSFEAVEGGLMEDVEAVGNLRAATAVFRFADNQWQAEGRVMFNLNPSEAIAYYGEHLELVEHEPAANSSG